MLGFVAFFGGAIYFTRFDAAGVPAEEAIAHVPRESLIATGAAFLVPAFLTALAAVTFLVVLDSVIGTKKKVRRAAEDELTAARARLEDREAERAAALAKLEPQPAAPSDAEDPTEPGTEEAKKDQRSPDLEVLERNVEKARTVVREAEDECARKKKVVLRRFVVAGALLAGEFIIILPALDGISKWQDWALVAVAAAATVAASIVVLFKTSFTWFALASFVAVAVFVAVATYERTKNDTKVSPVALLRDGNKPAYGFFVTETKDRVYIALPQRKLHATTLKLADKSNRLLELKRDSVTSLQIGPLVRSERAYRRSLELAREICRVPSMPKKRGTAAVTRKKKRDKSKRAKDAGKRAAAAAAARKKKTPPLCDQARFAAIRLELRRVQKLDEAAKRARKLLRG